MDVNYLVVSTLTEMFEESNHLFSEEMKYYLHNALASQGKDCTYEGLANIIREWVENYPEIKTILGLKVAVKKVQSLT